MSHLPISESPIGCIIAYTEDLKGNFSSPRHFSSDDGKRPEKIESETHKKKNPHRNA